MSSSPPSSIPLHSQAGAMMATVNYLTPPMIKFLSRRRRGSGSFSVRVASDRYYSDFNLYELLGVDSSSEKAQIKQAYRTLQKRCHPDIAGPSGHDMAIVLNEAYALLADERTRMAYDKELAKLADLQGYTGRPLYSVWQGSDDEERAVFVDEVKCVGCLKCALFAEKTFAIESVYGRARVVAQWADPEHKIQEAMGSCPVDCISIVERSNLAALEFIMSKQPRGKVRVGASNTVGERTPDIFNELEKFQTRYANHRTPGNTSQESESQRASRVSAIHAIQSIRSWLYWQSPPTDSTPTAAQNSHQWSQQRHRPSLKKLKAAAEARRQNSSASQHDFSHGTNEYWMPPAHLQMESSIRDTSSETPFDPKPIRKTSALGDIGPKTDSSSSKRWGVPTASAIVAAVIVRLQSEPVEPVGHVKYHIGGPLALSIVNSPWLQVVLAGITWFLVGIYVVELVEALRRKQ